MKPDPKTAWPWPAVLSTIFAMFALNVSASSLPLLLEQRGLKEEAGVIFAFFPLLSIFSLFFSACAVNKWGSKQVAIAAILLNIPCVIGYGLASNLWTFVIFHGAHGVVTMFTLPVLVANMRSLNQEGNAYAFTMGAALFAGGIGYLIGNWLLAEKYVTNWVLFGSILYLAVLYCLQKSPTPHIEEMNELPTYGLHSLIDRKVILVGLLGFGLYGAYRAVFSFLPFQVGQNAKISEGLLSGILILIATASNFAVARLVSIHGSTANPMDRSANR